jgi:hypothetical protein
MSTSVNANKWFSYLDTREIDNRIYKLLSDLVYIDPVHGPIVVPKGFVTDYASLDILRNIFLFVFFALLTGYGDKAATVHDYIYSGSAIRRPSGTIHWLSRKEADDMFYRALRKEGVARWRATIFWAGVRVGARHKFKGPVR